MNNTSNGKFRMTAVRGSTFQAAGAICKSTYKPNKKVSSMKTTMTYMKPAQIFILAAAPCVLLPAIASATTVNVTAMDNIFASGLSSAATVDPAGGGGGTLPLQIGVTGSSYQFQYLSGTV